MFFDRFVGLWIGLCLVNCVFFCLWVVVVVGWLDFEWIFGLGVCLCVCYLFC